MSLSDIWTGLDFETLLRCPVCFELSPEPILLCATGHHICQRCRKLLKNCPTCKASLTNTRNFIAEDLIKKNDFLVSKPPEEEKKGNCRCKTPKLKIIQSALPGYNLPRGVYECPLEGCSNCTNPLGLGSLIPHIKKAHVHLYSIFSNSIASFSADFILPYRRQKHHQKAIHISNMGLFFLSVNIFGDHTINCCLRYATLESVANKFKYEIEVSNSKQTFSHIDKIPILEKSFHWLLQRGRILVIPSEEHSLFGEFNVKVTIVNSVKVKNGRRFERL